MRRLVAASKSDRKARDIAISEIGRKALRGRGDGIVLVKIGFACYIIPQNGQRHEHADINRNEMICPVSE
jgi:hypothetical protein